MKKELTLTDILIERAKREEKYFKNYRFYAKRIKKTAQELLGEVKVFVFGSMLKKDEVPRDIDVMVISPNLKSSIKKSKIRVKLQKKLGFSSPFQIHLVTLEEYRDWYKNFIKEKIEI